MILFVLLSFLLLVVCSFSFAKGVRPVPPQQPEKQQPIHVPQQEPQPTQTQEPTKLPEPVKAPEPIKVPEPESQIVQVVPKKNNVVVNPILLELELLQAPVGRYSRYNGINTYDDIFKTYSKRFFTVAFDYMWFKAQAIIESNLKPNATSPVGAMGLMQIMPGTWKEITLKEKSITGGVWDPKWNIAGGIYYMSDIWSRWKTKRTWMDHLSFVLGSYNAGRGNIIKAQSLAGKKGMDTEVWVSIVSNLPAITGKHSTETIGYVNKIKQCRRDLR
jgi:hypothetical protein